MLVSWQELDAAGLSRQTRARATESGDEVTRSLRTRLVRGWARPGAPGDALDHDVARLSHGRERLRAVGSALVDRALGIATLKDDIARLRLHVIPLIGHMAIAEVRPKHIRDLVNALKHKTRDAPKCNGEPLAPRTVRRIYGTVRVLFKSAV